MILDAAVRDSAFPGAYAVIGNRAGVLAEYGAGHLDWKPSPAPDAHTLWDMASLTKCMATTTAVMRMVQYGQVRLNDPVARYIPEFGTTGKEQITVRQLLTHT